MSIKEKYIKEAIEISVSSGILSFSYKYLDLEDIEILFLNLRNNYSITELMLNSCGIIGEKIKLLAKFLLNNETINKLYLCNNMIGNNECKILANMLLHNKTLTMIDLRGNLITDKGLKYLAKSLYCNFSCKDMYLFSYEPKEIKKILNRNKNIDQFRNFLKCCINV